MANTYTQIYLHVVFGVEGRQSLIPAEHNDERSRRRGSTSLTTSDTFSKTDNE